MPLKPPEVPIDDLNSFVSLEARAAKKTLGTSQQFVDAEFGSDSNDGLSWGSAKQTLEVAHDTMPDGGRMYLASCASTYEATVAKDWGGFHVEADGGAQGGIHSVALIRKKYNGNLFDFGAKGGFLRNLVLYDDDATVRTGAAIAGTSSASAGGSILCENVTISGTDAAHAWERDVVLNGSAWATFGIRKCEFDRCKFFGCRTADETIKITRGVHVKFSDCVVDPAPTAVTQGIKLIDTGTTDVMFSGQEIIGNFSTEASGGRVLYSGGITGIITCQAASAGNVFFVTGTGSTPTWTNLGSDTNTIQGPTRYNNIASAATLVVPAAAEVLMVSGTTGITTITPTGLGGRRLTLIFSNAAPGAVTDGGNMFLAGGFSPTQWDTISFVCDGANWFETSRSVN